MATPTSRAASNKGPIQPQVQAPTNQAMNKNAVMTNGDSTATAVTDEAEGEDDSDDSNHTNDEDDADALALSGAQNSEQRLAGLKSNGQSGQAKGGAATDSANCSDDDDYAGVEDISDDEDFVQDSQVLKAAEADLIDEFERSEDRRKTNVMTAEMDGMFLQDEDALARRLSLTGSENQQESFNPSDPFDLDVDMNANPFGGLDFGDSQYQEMYNDAETALGAWRNERHNSADSMERKKKVRFQEPHEMLSRSSSMSSASEDENENTNFPDLFDAQDDPALRNQFGLDTDLDAAFNDYDDTGSCYDFDEDERLALEIDEESDSDDDTSTLDCKSTRLSE